MLHRIRFARTLCVAFLSIITLVALTGCHKGRSFVVFGSGFGYHDHHRHRDYCPPPRRHHHHGHHGHHRGRHHY